ncbi:hypothetical protein OS493_039550 [Desmophyllum pertusum]|uniref:Uncharacterized protein n=1 Tax=Desmophyllum pertusum TaxID=174260 RepID=A0A9W9ZVD5_9CNID|nr:hypothetical protein OS493_039550 [Desmophyllum pertusum]
MTWRLQRAFFTKQSVGSLGCRGITCRDFFPILSCCHRKHDPTQHPLVMADLEQIKPQYISNVAVDYWRKKPSLKEPSYSVMLCPRPERTNRPSARRTRRGKETVA